MMRIIAAIQALFIALPVLADDSQPADTQSSSIKVSADDKDGSPMPLICVRNGRFIEKQTGKEFRPRGFNYIRLAQSPKGAAPAIWHSTFAPGHYDALRAEAMFADLESHGFNIVRVFIDHRAGNGIVESIQSTDFSPKYMGNLLDFLQRARKHRIYVVPALGWFPNCRKYNQIVGQKPKNIWNRNSVYLNQGHIDAKARYLADFVLAVKNYDADLLTTLFAIELENESHLTATAPPFSQTTGTFTAADGRTYDLASPESLQQLADDNVNRWADTCVEAVRKVDPEIMVSTSVFTFAAVGRSGPGKFRHDRTKDKRFPARPLALARTRLSYLDIHFYHSSPQSLDTDLKSIEFDKVKAACRQRGMPLIVGEFGAIKHWIKDLSYAVTAMQQDLGRFYQLGFLGYMYWTYDCDEQEMIWNAKSGQGQIFNALVNMHRN